MNQEDRNKSINKIYEYANNKCNARKKGVQDMKV